MSGCAWSIAPQSAVVGSQPYVEMDQSRDASSTPRPTDGGSVEVVRVGIPARGRLRRGPAGMGGKNCVDLSNFNSTWTSDESTWPQDRDLAMFGSGFTIDLHNVGGRGRRRHRRRRTLMLTHIVCFRIQVDVQRHARRTSRQAGGAPLAHGRSRSPGWRRCGALRPLVRHWADCGVRRPRRSRCMPLIPVTCRPRSGAPASLRAGCGSRLRIVVSVVWPSGQLSAAVCRCRMNRASV